MFDFFLFVFHYQCCRIVNKEDVSVRLVFLNVLLMLQGDDEATVCVYINMSQCVASAAFLGL